MQLNAFVRLKIYFAQTCSPKLYLSTLKTKIQNQKFFSKSEVLIQNKISMHDFKGELQLRVQLF